MGICSDDFGVVGLVHRGLSGEPTGADHDALLMIHPGWARTRLLPLLLPLLTVHPLKLLEVPTEEQRHWHHPITEEHRPVRAADDMPEHPALSEVPELLSRHSLVRLHRSEDGHDRADADVLVELHEHVE